LTQSIHFQRHHFTPDLSPKDAKELFRTSVRYVEIETFTYCNRKCWFCPNATMPERQDKAGNRFMDRELYLRIMDELASINYRGQIQFGRYNEPLAEAMAFMWCVRQARARLPLAYLYTHTNGDFLGRPEMEELHRLGLNEIKIQTYLGNEQRWEEQAILDRQTQQLNRLGLRIRKTICAASGFRHFHETDYPGMLVTVDARNFDLIGTDRGGLLQIQQERPRTAPCMIPFERLYVDWDGSVVPCCNIRSDRPEHAEFVVSRLQDGTSIFQAFAALHGWRKSLLRFSEKGGPCATCRYDEGEVAESAAPELQRIYELATCP
jgi:hypothetical protein